MLFLTRTCTLLIRLKKSVYCFVWLKRDHRMLLDDGMDDPVGKTEPDAPVTVSSGEDEDFSS